MAVNKNITRGFLLCNLAGGFCFAQSENEPGKKAYEHYTASQFAQAAAMYAELLSNSPDNTAYNYYYGVSVLLSSKNKSAEALKFLEIASQNEDAPPLTLYYLAKACHLNYEFDKALKVLEKIKQNSVRYKNLPVAELEQNCINARACDYLNGEKLIISEEETNFSNFINQHNLRDNAGQFLVMPDKFKKGKGNKNQLSKYIFLSASKNYLVFSGPGNAPATELFIADKGTASKWNKPRQVKFKIRDKEDKLNPVISEDGNTIYFSSKGMKSNGGFDIFKTTFDNNNQYWTEPENVGFPANSPYDEFYYVPVPQEQAAYVNSQRECADGNIRVIKIKLSEDVKMLPLAYTSFSTDEITSQFVESLPDIKLNEQNIGNPDSVYLLPLKLINTHAQENAGKKANEIPAGLIYKVQIGAFKLKPAEEVLQKFLVMNIDNISYETSKNGVIFFYSGNSSDLFEVIEVKNAIIAKGVNDAYIVAFRNNIRMPMEQALLYPKR